MTYKAQPTDVVDWEKLNEWSDQIGSFSKRITWVSVKEFGAIGDGVTDDTQAFNDAFQSLSPGKVLFVPPGTYIISSTLVIPPTANGAMMCGVGSIQSLGATVLEINNSTGISLLAIGFTFKDIKIKLTGTYATGTILTIIKDNGTTSNLDVHIDGCSFENATYVLDANGRGVTIKNCLFYQIYQAWVYINDFLWTDTDPYFTKNDGMRGYFLSGNRSHYSHYCYAIENIGANAQNIVGIQIVNNIFESGRIINGAMKDALITGNILYQQDSTGDEALFNCTTINNTVISGNSFKGEDVTGATYASVLIATGDVNNLTITGNGFSNVNKNTFMFSGLVTNLMLDGNVARKICVLNGSYVVFLGTTNKNIVINDIIESPERSDWVAIQKGASANVYEYKINSIVKGTTYLRLHAFKPINHSDTSVNRNITGQISGTYVGTGSGTKTIDFKFRPAYVRIYSSDGTKNLTKTCDATGVPQITFYDGGVTFDATLNASGVEYYWTAF